MFSEKILHHSQLLYHSFARTTGKSLLQTVPISEEFLAQALYEAPFVLLSHDTQTDPVFNYANLTAQQLWEMDWAQFTRLPSRLSAEPVAMAERQAMLGEAREKGYLSDYQGVRISSSGRRFLIKGAILWSLYDAQGAYQGQAAFFQDWTFL